MNEKEFADAFCGKYKIKGDEICPKYCPVRGGRHNKDEYTSLLCPPLHTGQYSGHISSPFILYLPQKASANSFSFI